MNTSVRLLQILNHALFFSLFMVFFDFAMLFAGICLYLILLYFGVSLGFHRLFSHRAFKTYRFMEYILLYLGAAATLGSSIAWAGLHLRHHANSDRAEDPHSPLHGRLKSWFGYWKKARISPKSISHLFRDRKHKIFHRHYFLILFLHVFFLFLLFGPEGVIYLYCLPAVICFHVTSMVNVLGHSAAKQSQATGDFSKNIPALSFFSSGESYHFNHHKSPRSLRFGPWDMGYFFAKMIERN